MSTKAVDQIFVVSGSCSPATGAQIEKAVRAGFEGVALDPIKLIEEGAAGPYGTEAVDHIVGRLKEGAASSPIVRPGPAIRAKRW